MCPSFSSFFFFFGGWGTVNNVKFWPNSGVLWFAFAFVTFGGRDNSFAVYLLDSASCPC